MGAVALNHKIFGEGRALIIVHGLFGSLDNWQTHAKTFSQYFRVILVDARNHGHSPHTDEHTYDMMADDLRVMMEQLQIDEATFVGHSMGGKAVMRFAQKFPLMVDKLLVVDMGIKQYPAHHDLILQGLHAVDFDKAISRSQAEKLMEPYIHDFAVRQFLMKNLYWVEPGKRLAWRMNLSTLERCMPDILLSLPDVVCSLPTLFLRGELSNYILDEDIEHIEHIFPSASIETIYGAGHWVHAEKPKEFMDAVLHFCLF